MPELPDHLVDKVTATANLCTFPVICQYHRLEEHPRSASIRLNSSDRGLTRGSANTILTFCLSLSTTCFFLVHLFEVAVFFVKIFAHTFSCACSVNKVLVVYDVTIALVSFLEVDILLFTCRSHVHTFLCTAILVYISYLSLT